MSEQGKRRALCRNEQRTCYLSSVRPLLLHPFSVQEHVHARGTFFFFSNDNSCSYDPAVDALFLHTFSEFPMHIDLNPDPCPWMNKTPIPEAGVFQAWSIYFARRGRHSVSDMSRGQIRKQNHLRLVTEYHFIRFSTLNKCFPSAWSHVS